MICLGDKVRVIDGDLYLGRRIRVGTTGRVVGRKQGVTGQHLYFVQLDGTTEVYTMASSEFEVLSK